MPVKELYVTFKAFRFRMNYSTISVFDLSDVVLEERAGLGSPFSWKMTLTHSKKPNSSISYSLS